MVIFAKNKNYDLSSGNAEQCNASLLGVNVIRSLACLLSLVVFQLSPVV